MPINKKSGPVRAKRSADKAGDGAAGTAIDQSGESSAAIIRAIGTAGAAPKKRVLKAKAPTAKAPRAKASKTDAPKARVPTAKPASEDTAARAAGPKTVAVPASKSGTAPAARAASLRKIVIDALDDMKALEVKVLDVRGLTDVADTMVIASGTSDRHVRSVAKNVVEKTKAAGFRPHGVEGQQDSDWVLIDLHEMIVHVMLPRTREFYGLEKLWDMTATKRAARA